MSIETEARIRVAKRHDVTALVELRVSYLAEMARLEPRLQLLPDVRERTLHALTIWIDQRDRVLLVADALESREGPGSLAGYAMGVPTIWPPIFRNQHVGEIAEVYVEPQERGRSIGRRLVEALTSALRDLGVGVLRASVPEGNEVSLTRFHASGYHPLLYVLQRGLEEG